MQNAFCDFSEVAIENFSLSADFMGDLLALSIA